MPHCEPSDLTRRTRRVLAHDSVYERLLSERIIFLGLGRVNDEIANRLCAQICCYRRRRQQGHQPLHQSAGWIDQRRHGDLRHYGAGAQTSPPMGAAASMGEFLLAAQAGKATAILMHQPLRVTGAADIAIQAEQFAVIKKEMFRNNAEFTGQPIERIEADSIATAGSPPPKPWNTVSSITSSPAPTSMEKHSEFPKF